jgi:3' exoribonuclease family, domain 2
VQAGRYVWSLRVDVRVLDNGGSLATAASVAVRTRSPCHYRRTQAACLNAAQVLAALLSHRRPEASVSAETGEVVEHSPSLREPLALSLHHKPLAVAFALFQGTGCTHVVMDPSAAEEKGCRGTLVVMANSHFDLCCISQCGGVSPTRQQLLDCVSEAHREVAAMLALVNAELERHSLERIRSRVRRHAAGAPPPLLLGQPLSSAGVSLGGLPGESSGEEEEVVQADAVPGAPFPFSGSIQPEVRSDRPPAPAEGLPERAAAAVAAVAAASLPVPHLQAASLTDAVKHKRR